MRDTADIQIQPLYMDNEAILSQWVCLEMQERVSVVNATYVPKAKSTSITDGSLYLLISKLLHADS